MTRIAALLMAVAVGALLIWFAASHVLSGATLATDWPQASFVSQFPDRQENESATRLLATAERFGRDLAEARPALSDYIRKRGAAPKFLEQHANTIRTLRAQVVSNPPPVWALQIDDILEPPQPPFGLHMQLFTLLAADSLSQHSQKNDAAAWTDLHAAWILSQSLWQRPEVMSIATAMVGCRLVAATAAKLDPPVPAWWAEVAAFDTRLPLLRAIEYEAWATRARADRYPAGESDGSRFDDTVRQLVAPFVRPVRVAQTNITTGRLRELATAAVKADPCEPFVIAVMPEWAGFVRRFLRFQIEREGVDKLLALKSGGVFSASSQCRSGRWSYDGVELAFRGPVPPQTSPVTIIPLAYRLRVGSAALH